MKYTDTETRKSEEQHRADIHQKINVIDKKKGKDRMLQNLNQTDVAQFVSAAVTSYTIPFQNNKPEISFAKKHVAKFTEDKNKQEI